MDKQLSKPKKREVTCKDIHCEDCSDIENIIYNECWEQFNKWHEAEIRKVKLEADNYIEKELRYYKEWKENVK